MEYYSKYIFRPFIAVFPVYQRIAVTFLFILITTYGTTAQIINTYAGNGVTGFSGDGGAATTAELDHPFGMAIDASGNFYVADEGNQRVRKISPSGIITTIAGTGVGGFSGDGGAATAAKLNYPVSVALDTKGNIYIADTYNERIRKISPSGIISTFAGKGIAGFSGDGGPATAAEIYFPYSVAVDKAGNVYIADFYNNRIRKVDTTGIIVTVAGNGTAGYSGDGGAATAAELYQPSSVAIDAGGNILITDEYNNRVREVNTSGIISTIAGNGTSSFSGDGGPATAAEIYYPIGVIADVSGNIFISDYGNNRIREINGVGVINTVAGNGTAGYSGDGGPATAAELNNPIGLTMDTTGNIYIADYVNSRIRIMSGLPLGFNNPQKIIEVEMYPVPSNGQVTLSMLNTNCTGMDIYDLEGRNVYSRTLDLPSGEHVEIDLGNLPTGIYIVKVITSLGVTFKHIAIE